jgi:hypothetical protein
VAELEALVAANPNSPPLEVLERAFRSHFIDAQDTDFDSTLFHYLLTRLGATGSRIAVDYSLSVLNKRPEETEPILRYLAKLEPLDRDDDRIFDYLETPEALYDYQVFLILRHYFESQRYPQRLLGYCRKVIRDAAIALYVKTYAVGILGEAGEDADLEFIEAQYAAAVDEVQRATIICSCHRMELGRRNAFFGRARTDGSVEGLAVAWSRRRDQAADAAVGGA